MRINLDLKKLARTVVPVNFSVSSQGNATWVVLATTNTARGGDRERYY